MIDNIRAEIPRHELSISEASPMYVVDYKNLNGGGVKLLESRPNDIRFILLNNLLPIRVNFIAFNESALLNTQQCEGVMFPSSSNENDWILFIECKYAYSLAQATNKAHGYPKKMISQIISTVGYFRDKSLIAKDKRVTAIVAFPNLMEEFNSWFFTDEETVEDILINHKILIRATNSATIKSSKRITLHTT